MPSVISQLAWFISSTRIYTRARTYGSNVWRWPINKINNTLIRSDNIDRQGWENRASSLFDLFNLIYLLKHATGNCFAYNFVNYIIFNYNTVIPTNDQCLVFVLWPHKHIHVTCWELGLWFVALGWSLWLIEVVVRRLDQRSRSKNMPYLWKSCCALFVSGTSGCRLAQREPGGCFVRAWEKQAPRSLVAARRQIVFD